MDNWQPSTLSWSFSRKTHFDSCRRHYFFHRFWGQDPKARWRLFEMRNLTTITMLRGQVVHSVIANALQSIRYDIKLDAKTARANITALLRERYGESARRLWHIDNRPPGRKASEITSLLEHYYNFPNLNQRARDAQQVAWQCITNLIESDFWANIENSDPGEWREVEESHFPSFELEGIQVYTTIDFAHANGSPTIIDWKTGTPSEQDRRQLTLYSLYAQKRWEWDPLQTTLQAVYLQPELVVESFTPSLADLESVTEDVKASLNDMAELEPAYGPADIERFPMTQDTSNCAWCRFQGICRMAKRIDLDSTVVSQD
ncbi:MAG: PD-(D/E)XK nuclease family protein [Armatimonadota bacterium]|nr:PD-(D/E)XK nuclease family protein [bacterium]